MLQITVAVTVTVRKASVTEAPGARSTATTRARSPGWHRPLRRSLGFEIKRWLPCQDPGHGSLSRDLRSADVTVKVGRETLPDHRTLSRVRTRCHLR